MRSKAWAGLLLLSITRCSCEEDLTRVVDPPDSGRPMDPRAPLDAGQRADPDSGEMVVEPDAGELDSGEGDSGATTDQLCESLAHEALSRSFTFSDVGPCPWGQGDNLPLEGAVGWSARTEQIETFSVPENAVICAASFEVPQTDMWFDDAMVIAFSQVVLMTDANVGLFPSDGAFYLYDWMAMRGGRGSALYCLESCMLPAMETPGPMSLSISADLARAIGERAAEQGTYELRVVTIGDNDAGDCRHQPFDFVVTLDYVVP